MKRIALVFATVIGTGFAIGIACHSAEAQGYASHNPNMNHFYMARQQITITDDAPVVNDQRTNPAAGGPTGQGSMPRRAVPLPRATWMPYSSTIESPSSGLPQVNNGLPPKAPPTMSNPSGMKGKAGKLASSKSKSAKSKAPSPPVVQSYTPYRGYGAPAQMTKKGSDSGGQQVAGYGGSYQKTQTNVRGSVLHWARVKKKSME